MQSKALCLSLAVLAAIASAPLAARPLVDIAVVDRDSGQTLRQYPHRGDTWVAGTPGRPYSVRLANTSAERVLVVLSIDGINAVTGQTADPSQAGYVLEPWQSAEIEGWRKSLHEVARFEFTDLGDSYAARTGRPGEVGVIGVAVFREYRAPRSYPRPPAVARESEAAPAAQARSEAAADSAAPAAPAANRSAQALGTGHGQREWSPVDRTGFQRASDAPAQITQLRYDDLYRLRSLGMVPRILRTPVRHEGPRAFPGFVADPPNR